jgi:RNA polymerase sigma factor (sigma-70 family)
MKRKSTYHVKKIDLNRLARRLAEGDARAIELIYRNFFHKLLYYGVQVAGQHYQNEVEDVIQEFFIWLVQNSAKACQIRDFETYMFQSIRRNLHSRISEEKNGKATFKRYVKRTAPLQESLGLSPEQLKIQKEEVELRSVLLQQELDKLPSCQREVLYLRYFEGKSYPEIAAILSVTYQVAYNYVYRAIKRLKGNMANLAFFSLILFGLLRTLF